MVTIQVTMQVNIQDNIQVNFPLPIVAFDDVYLGTGGQMNRPPVPQKDLIHHT